MDDVKILHERWQLIKCGKCCKWVGELGINELISNRFPGGFLEVARWSYQKKWRVLYEWPRQVCIYDGIIQSKQAKVQLANQTLRSHWQSMFQFGCFSPFFVYFSLSLAQRSSCDHLWLPGCFITLVGSTLRTTWAGESMDGSSGLRIANEFLWNPVDTYIFSNIHI